MIPLYYKLKVLFPDLKTGGFSDPDAECVIRDDEIVVWRRKEDQPTAKELDDVSEKAVVMFNLGEEATKAYTASEKS